MATQTTILRTKGLKEVKTGHEDLFWDMDKDRSGNLSMDELEKLMDKSGYTLSKAELSTKFQGTDSDKDGNVSYDEYLKGMGVVTAFIHRQAFYRRKFKRYDLNKDGVISLDELEKVFESIGASSNVTYAKEAFKQCDKDGSGEIEYEEFIKFFCTGE